jgi:hypothetical protein
MTPFLLRPRTLVLAAIVFTFPLAGGSGCNQRQACFTFTSSEFAKNSNSCPAQSGALVNFTDPNCPGSVTSVDSAGDFDPLDGNTGICCYTVTYAPITPDCGSSPGGQGGSNVGGFSSGDAAGGSFGSAVAVGVGGSAVGGNGPGCFTCSDMIQGSTMGTKNFCNDSQGFASALSSCACSSCSASCQSSLCANTGTSSDCFTCLQGMCGSQLVDCESH